MGIARIAWHLYSCVCPAGAFLECAGARVLRWADKGRRELRVGATEAAPQDCDAQHLPYWDMQNAGSDDALTL